MTEIEDQAVQILSNEGAQCGECGDEPGDRVCPDCEKCRARYVAALRAAGWGPRAEFDAELAKLRDLLRVENKRANDAIDREETAEQAALEAQQDRPAVLREAANGLAALGPLDSLVSAPAAWTEAIETLRRMADQIAEDEARRMADEAHQAEPESVSEPFIYTDADAAKLAIGAQDDGGRPVVSVVADEGARGHAAVYVLPEDIEHVVAALRDARRNAQALHNEAQQAGERR